MADESRITIWDNPEWRVLFDITRLGRVKPWRIKLVEIIKALMLELERIKSMDLRSCGIAAYSAAVIHKMKTERLLEADTPRTPREKPNILVPPPLNLPFIPEFMITAVSELINALQIVLNKKRGEKAVEERPHFEGFEVKLDEFLVKLEEELEEFINELRRRFNGVEVIEFSELIDGADRLQAARQFILLLFTAAKGIIELIQGEDGALRVRWIGGAE